jgi:anaerobic selenocysteine-containing dehydrogenase
MQFDRCQPVLLAQKLASEFGRSRVMQDASLGVERLDRLEPGPQEGLEFGRQLGTGHPSDPFAPLAGSTCPHDCPSTCALEVDLLAAQPHRPGARRADNSYTAGVICAKVARYAERIHHPDRLLIR